MKKPLARPLKPLANREIERRNVVAYLRMEADRWVDPLVRDTLREIALRIELRSHLRKPKKVEYGEGEES